MQKVQKKSGKANSVLFLDLLFKTPVITINEVKNALQVSYPTARTLMDKFCKAKIIRCLDESAQQK